MIIKDVRVFLAKEWRTFLFVEIETEDGVVGLGEAGLTGREFAVAGAIEHFKALLVGEDASRIEHIWQRLYRGGFFPPGPILSSAISAIDLALWDIKGKALGAPVYQLLGGRTRDKVRCYNHLHGDSDAVVDHAVQSVEEGWKSLRWEPQYFEGNVIDSTVSVREAIRGLQNIRKAVGPDIELSIDAHQRFTPGEARRFCKAVEELDLLFVEDALRAEAAALYPELRAQTSTRLAAGEQFPSKWAYKTLVEQRLIDYARLDLCVGGGLTEAKKIAGWCETNLIDIAVHNPLGPVSTAACLHFNLSIPNFGVMELPRRPGECLSDAVLGQPEWEDGYLLPSDEPGFGLTLNHEALARYPFEPGELPHLTRPDGSVANW